jgi:hypothetical protein
MVTIQTEFGEFTGTTLRDAQRQLRKAEKERRELEIRQAKDRKIAYAFAAKHGFDELKREIMATPLSHPWYLRPSDKGFPGQKTGERSWTIRLSQEGPSTELIGYEPLYVRMSPSGDVEMLWTRDMDGNREVYKLCCGVYNDQYACLEMPSKTMPPCPCCD